MAVRGTSARTGARPWRSGWARRCPTVACGGLLAGTEPGSGKRDHGRSGDPGRTRGRRDGRARSDSRHRRRGRPHRRRRCRRRRRRARRSTPTAASSPRLRRHPHPLRRPGHAGTRLLAPSFFHGVTTVVMGNCGVGFAPVRPGRQDFLIALMEGVEDIPGTALHEGIRWDWESFPEYLDALEAHGPRAIDIGTQLPHGSLRAYVMDERGGQRAGHRRRHRPDGASWPSMRCGPAPSGSTNRLAMHTSKDGRPVRGPIADEGELFAIGRAVARAGGGVVEIVSAEGMGTSPGGYRADVDWAGASPARPAYRSRCASPRSTTIPTSGGTSSAGSTPNRAAGPSSSPRWRAGRSASSSASAPSIPSRDAPPTTRWRPCPCRSGRWPCATRSDGPNSSRNRVRLSAWGGWSSACPRRCSRSATRPDYEPTPTPAWRAQASAAGSRHRGDAARPDARAGRPGPAPVHPRRIRPVQPRSHRRDALRPVLRPRPRRRGSPLLADLRRLGADVAAGLLGARPDPWAPPDPRTGRRQDDRRPGAAVPPVRSRGDRSRACGPT